nr:hypothetical protein [Bacteroides sp.]
MKKASWIMACFMFASSVTAGAQIVESSPTPLQQSSKDVVLTYHADQGTAGLKGLTSGVYTHIGVITNKSDGSWTYAPSKWGDNADKYALEFVSTDTWRLNIGDIRTYFGITDPDEEVLKLAMVFRNADCTKEGKGPGGADIFLDVYPDQFSMSLASSLSGSVLNDNTSATFTVSSTEACELSLFVNDTKVANVNGTSLKADYTFSGRGEYVVKATADNGKETVTESLTYLVAPEAVAADYPGGTPRMGAVKNDDGSVTFCLAAPQKSSVILVGSWDDYATLGKNVMNYQDYEGHRYFWLTVEGLESGVHYPYYYIVDGATKVADPYAHLVLDPYSDKWLTNNLEGIPSYPYDRFEDTALAVYCDTLDDYDWEVTDFEIPAHDNLVIYELLIRDFGGDGSGTGTIKDVHSHLNYLKNLGVNAIELMPIMEFNGNNSWGYNTNFYMAPDKAYGTPAEYKKLIDTLHKMGFAVILDIVFNQSDGLHPWYRMYDIKENPFYNAHAPHDYSVLNDWRQDHPLVQQQWEDALRYWMTEYKVDGFRFDLVKGLGDNDSYTSGTEAYNPSRVANMTRLHSVITSVNPAGIHINEHLAGAKEENEMAADGQLNWSNMNNAACQVAMGYQSDADMSGMYAPRNGSRTAGSTVAYCESHDEERMGYKQTQWGATNDIKTDDTIRMRRLGSVAAQMLMTPGSKMIWQFAELGADQSTKSSDGSNNTDPKKVVWGYLDNAARAGLYQSYRELCWMRQYNPDLFSADANVTLSLNGWADGRYIVLSNGDNEAVLLVNPETSKSVVVSAPVTKISDANNQVISASFATEPAVVATDGNVSCELAPGAYVLVGTSDLTEIDSIMGSEPAVSVRGENGRITIVGDYTSAAVFDLMGRSYPSLRVPAGTYVVNVDGVASKVIVK